MTAGNDQLDMGAVAMEGLLGEYRGGNIGERELERTGLRRHLAVLSRRWDEQFSRHGRRDAYLKGIVVGLLGGCQDGTIVNPACVWGRHSRDLARRLAGFAVLGTDINPRFGRCYRRLPHSRTPSNYAFKKDDIFNPNGHDAPTAVVFFGACASLADAALDYAIASRCPLLVGRACCHAMIGGNTNIVKRPDFSNRMLRFQIRVFARRLARLKANGHYFSPKYSAQHYPRSETARRLTNSKEVIEVARNALNSDICRSIIDLDRFLYLAEAGYDVRYRAEMFVAELVTSPARKPHRSHSPTSSDQ